MKVKIGLLFMFCVFAANGLHAQQQPGYPVTDSLPVVVNGLEMGYAVKSEETKKVGDKGDFSRYSMTFFVTNTSPESKIILYKQGFNLLNEVSDQLVLFNCLNATGARFTTKQVTITAPACNILALVNDVDANNKPKQNKRLVQIGYWIQPGQTIKAGCIMIVPLGQKPQVQAVYLAGTLQPAANTIVTDYSPQGSPPPYKQQGGAQSYGPGFSKIRNVHFDTYLNNQTGAVTSTAIQTGWWSAQWMLIPVPGTNNLYNIQNKWKQTYLATDRNGIGLFGSYLWDGARWQLEHCRDGNTLIRNVESGEYLYMYFDQLALLKDYNAVSTAEWSIEQP